MVIYLSVIPGAFIGLRTRIYWLISLVTFLILGFSVSLHGQAIDPVVPKMSKIQVELGDWYLRLPIQFMWLMTDSKNIWTSEELERSLPGLGLDFELDLDLNGKKLIWFSQASFHLHLTQARSGGPGLSRAEYPIYGSISTGLGLRREFTAHDTGSYAELVLLGMRFEYAHLPGTQHAARLLVSPFSMMLRGSLAKRAQRFLAELSLSWLRIGISGYSSQVAKVHWDFAAFFFSGAISYLLPLSDSVLLGPCVGVEMDTLGDPFFGSYTLYLGITLYRRS